MATKFKSSLEIRIAKQIEDKGFEVVYEDINDRLTYEKTYQPDFRLPSGVLVETKGYHRNFGDALSKLNSVKRSNPGIDLRIVWQNASMLTPFRTKGKKLTAAQWSEKNGWKWADKEIPDDWF